MRWTPEEVAVAISMRKAGKLFTDIAAVLPGRSPKAICSMLIDRGMRNIGTKVRAGRRLPTIMASEVTISPEALADRDRRQSLAPRDLTAAFCNDPLPGYSALDRRQS